MMFFVFSPLLFILRKALDVRRRCLQVSASKTLRIGDFNQQIYWCVHIPLCSVSSWQKWPPKRSSSMRPPLCFMGSAVARLKSNAKKISKVEHNGWALHFLTTPPKKRLKNDSPTPKNDKKPRKTTKKLKKKRLKNDLKVKTVTPRTSASSPAPRPIATCWTSGTCSACGSGWALWRRGASCRNRSSSRRLERRLAVGGLECWAGFRGESDSGKRGTKTKKAKTLWGVGNSQSKPPGRCKHLKHFENSLVFHLFRTFLLTPVSIPSCLTSPAEQFKNTWAHGLPRKHIFGDESGWFVFLPLLLGRRPSPLGSTLGALHRCGRRRQRCSWRAAEKGGGAEIAVLRVFDAWVR